MASAAKSEAADGRRTDLTAIPPPASCSSPRHHLDTDFIPLSCMSSVSASPRNYGPGTARNLGWNRIIGDDHSEKLGGEIEPGFESYF